MSLIKREHRSAWPLQPMWTDDVVDRMFRDMFGDVFGPARLAERDATTQAELMRLEEFLDGDTCVIRAEMPGIDPAKDVDVTVTDGMLHLQAHREERSETDTPDGYRSEFRYGTFERSIKLPEGATEADVKATYKDGILEVRVPVATTRKTATKVPVEYS